MPRFPQEHVLIVNSRVAQSPFRDRNADLLPPGADYWSNDALYYVKWVLFMPGITALSCVPVVILCLTGNSTEKKDIICFVIFICVMCVVATFIFRDIQTVSVMLLAYGALLANNLRMN